VLDICSFKHTRLQHHLCWYVLNSIPVCTIWPMLNLFCRHGCRFESINSRTQQPVSQRDLTPASTQQGGLTTARAVYRAVATDLSVCCHQELTQSMVFISLCIRMRSEQSIERRRVIRAWDAEMHGFNNYFSVIFFHLLWMTTDCHCLSVTKLHLAPLLCLLWLSHCPQEFLLLN